MVQFLVLSNHALPVIRLCPFLFARGFRGEVVAQDWRRGGSSAYTWWGYEPNGRNACFVRPEVVFVDSRMNFNHGTFAQLLDDATFFALSDFVAKLAANGFLHLFVEGNRTGVLALDDFEQVNAGLDFERRT